MEAMGIGHRHHQEDDKKVEAEAQQNQRPHRDMPIQNRDVGVDRHDRVPFNRQGDDIEADESRLVDDEAHDHDGGGVGDLNPLALQRIDLHDLTAGSAWCDVAIELADGRGGDALMVFVLPCVETTENEDDEALDEIRQGDQGQNQQDISNVAFGEGVDDRVEVVLE